jgi:hypothetical protein
VADPTNYISDLKRQLESESGISRRIRTQPKLVRELDDLSKKLDDYGIGRQERFWT